MQRIMSNWFKFNDLTLNPEFHVIMWSCCKIFHIPSHPWNNVLTSSQSISMQSQSNLDSDWKTHSHGEQWAAAGGTMSKLSRRIHLDPPSPFKWRLISEWRTCRPGVGGGAAEVSLMWFRSRRYVACTPGELMDEKRSYWQWFMHIEATYTSEAVVERSDLKHKGGRHKECVNADVFFHLGSNGRGLGPKDEKKKYLQEGDFYYKFSFWDEILWNCENVLI